MADYKHYLTATNIIALILGIIGLVWLIYGIWRNMKIRSINSWPKVQARVLNALAAPANRSAGDAFLDPANLLTLGNSQARYSPLVVYVYTVGRNSYQSTNVVYGGDKTYDAVATKTIMSQIVPGTDINVFYNPRHPSESYIFNSTPNYTGIIVGIILLLIAAYMLYQKNKEEINDVVKTKGRKSATPDLTEIESKLPNDATRPSFF